VIVSNAAWLAMPEIQRALLSNPTVAGQHLERVLRALPRPELARIAAFDGLSCGGAEGRRAARQRTLKGAGRSAQRTVSLAHALASPPSHAAR
jgi:hypothetical protein